MDAEDMVSGVNRDADRGTQDPMIRQRLGPQRIHLENRRFHTRLLSRRCLVQHELTDTESNEHSDKACPNQDITFPHRTPHPYIPLSLVGPH